ncbi:hypothetical protein NDU88_002612 [Pleurodeles waltl]|uniref:Uncharacterized protein n=1 Tax=Pleurodeles waltl TaxID=8319 RepID=A0AAV7NFW6_PLEWA|nr:hypothetical protein NDU88_002612 [Pleurodeles waltl]
MLRHEGSLIRPLGKSKLEVLFKDAPERALVKKAPEAVNNELGPVQRALGTRAQLRAAPWGKINSSAAPLEAEESYAFRAPQKHFAYTDTEVHNKGLLHGLWPDGTHASQRDNKTHKNKITGSKKRTAQRRDTLKWPNVGAL